MNIQYRQLFLKDLKKLKKTEIYERVYELAFTTLPAADSLQDISVKETAFRIDGVFLPSDDAIAKTVFFAEVHQKQKPQSRRGFC